MYAPDRWTQGHWLRLGAMTVSLLQRPPDSALQIRAIICKQRIAQASSSTIKRACLTRVHAISDQRCSSKACCDPTRLAKATHFATITATADNHGRRRDQCQTRKLTDQHN